MLQYEACAARTIDGWELQFKQLSADHRKLLPQYAERCSRAREAVHTNAEVLQSIIHEAEATQAIGPALTAANSFFKATGGSIDPVDAGKVGCFFTSVLMTGAPSHR